MSCSARAKCVIITRVIYIYFYVYRSRKNSLSLSLSLSLSPFLPLSLYIYIFISSHYQPGTLEESNAFEKDSSNAIISKYIFMSRESTANFFF